MTESTIWCLVLLINVPSRLSSGTEIVTKSVCQGDAVQLFRNVTFNNGSVVSIYINGDRQKLIGTGNSLSTFSIISDYKGKMFFDERDTFWILQIQRSDEQKYVLRTQIDTRITKDEVQIIVMVAPTKDCIPRLSKTDSGLIATLDCRECGHPSASVKWVEYPGVSYKDKSIVKLPLGNESGTYYACAESPALKCVTDFKISDYCSSFVVEANNSPAVSPGNTHVSSEMIVIIVILILILFLLVLIAILVLRNKRKQNEEAVSREEVLKKKSSVACGKQGKDRPAIGNDDENELSRFPPMRTSNRDISSRILLEEGILPPRYPVPEFLVMMEPTSYVETKSVKCIQSKGPAALMNTRSKDKVHRLIYGSEMRQGQIEGTGGIFIPLEMSKYIDDEETCILPLRYVHKANQF